MTAKQQAHIANLQSMKSFKYLFLNEEFTDLVDSILENTFFNII